MSGYVQERYKPVIVGVNATVQFGGSGLGGFIAITAGTITIGALANNVYTTIVNALPVLAGVYYPLPFYISHLGGQIVAAGGASGVLGVD